jgi:hypothetical protein
MNLPHCLAIYSICKTSFAMRPRPNRTAHSDARVIAAILTGRHARAGGCGR